MARRNGFSRVSERAIQRILQIVSDVSEEEPCESAHNRLLEEIRFHKETLKTAFEFRKSHGPELSIADSDNYFSEKLGGFISFAEMAVDPSLHGGNYSSEKIEDNVNHYSYLVAKLVAANWFSRATRPVSDMSLKESSFENRDALERLVNR